MTVRKEESLSSYEREREVGGGEEGDIIFEKLL